MSADQAGRTPKGKMMGVKVYMLDDQVQTFNVPQKCQGVILYNEVSHRLQLLEADYFDLEYLDEKGICCWLDHEKPLLKQVSAKDPRFRFAVKFYTPDPGLLEEEYTRYLFALQVKRDLASGDIPCSENTAALLASYIVQAELGDFLEEEYVDHTYLSNFKFFKNQSEDLELKIMEYHQGHIGQSPAEADFNLLDTARKVELYGIRMHEAKDHEGVPLTLAVAHMGVLVFQNQTKINTFSWAKIRKLSFKRKKFLIKLHPEGYLVGYSKHSDTASKIPTGYYKDTVEFYFDTRNECKNFWKKCIEHHAFFRCHIVKKLPRNRTRVVSRGSSFRYSGRTQKQLVEYVRENYVKRPAFERSTSARSIASRSYGANKSNTSTLNSNYGHNSTSSGSHILEQSPKETRDTPSVASTRLVEKAEVHDDSSQSASAGSLSEKSPRSQRTKAAVDNTYDSPPSTNKQMVDRKMSAPVFSQLHHPEIEEHELSRSSEVGNIPEILEEDEERTRHPRFRSPAPDYQNISEVAEAMREEAGVRERPTFTTGVQPERSEPIISSPKENGHVSPLPSYSDALEIEQQRSQVQSVTTVTTTTTTSSQRYIQDDDEPEPLPPPPPEPLQEVNSVSPSVARATKKYPADRAYYIAKELLMTERTYKKDLEVLTVWFKDTWFRNAASKEDVWPETLMHLMFSHLDPLYEQHCQFLREVEQRLAFWEGKSNAHLNGEYRRIGDVMLNNMEVLQLYINYIEKHEEILNEIQNAQRTNRKFETIYKEFEGQKVCYLPLNTFLLKPAQRLLHYQLILTRLLSHYNNDHNDYRDCYEALQKVKEITSRFEDQVRHLENLQKLVELQRDLVGIDNLVQPIREFIREGCLQKLSRKGYQQRMFFLFSDMLVYTSRTATPTLQFKVHGQLPLRGMIVEENGSKMDVANSFAIYGGNRCLMVAASTQEEKDKWIEDLVEAILKAKEQGDEKIKFQSLKSNASSEGLDSSDLQDDQTAALSGGEKQIQHRANTTMHVCWHRNTSVSIHDHYVAIENQLSGYLLRKFKNSNGWQKLWVVFTNFCLFFYKTFQDDFPLASLPLLGYSVTTPAESDNIHKDYVFKLQFKNHVYFFRAESEYTFERWVETLSSATQSAKRTRLFERLESSQPPNMIYPQ
ncbi:unnamed protein product [Owenia fusiformis]|uniref:FERM, ARHGEF and pleckstrin domain-containing protein 1 n=1 Tax=Owenia fusiformis TaxID=6347 RepID=A0A8J1Y066_OWEFU|nr:unnamed protein product [Owenia fusiformis]